MNEDAVLNEVDEQEKNEEEINNKIKSIKTKQINIIDY